MTIEEIKEIIANVAYENYEFKVFEKNGIPFVQARYIEADVITNDPSDQHTRKWPLAYLSEHMIESEVVQTLLLLVQTSAEHRIREHFLYKGFRIYGPHFDVAELVELCRQKKVDYRGKKKKAKA